MRFRTTGLALAVSLCLSRSATGFECTLADDPEVPVPYVSIHWQERSLSYAIRSPGSRTMQVGSVEAIQRGFNAWTVPTCTDLQVAYAGVVPPETDPREQSQVIFVDADWPHDPAAVALTTMTFALPSGVIRFGEMEINEAIYRFQDASGEGCDGPGSYDLEAVVTHEAGHFLGFAHTSVVQGGDRDPTMSPVVGECDPNFRSLEPDDIDAVCTVYPSAQPVRLCARLPEQAEPYVSNAAFGCRAAGPGSPSETGAALLLLLGLLLLRRRGPGRRNCDSGLP